MREIIFRGKNFDDSGKWEYGYYFKVWVCHFGKRSDEHCLHDYETDNEPEVYPDTIGQYTGLTDKNSTRIFEGDIVDLFGIRGLVVFECGTFGIATFSMDWDLLDRKIQEITGCNNSPNFVRNDNFVSLWEIMWNYNQEKNVCGVLEVLGNIHDTPELLKSEEV